MAPKRDKPETVRQAGTWENVKRRYADAGLCDGCAGQAAYGHQLGFTRIKDPCRTDAGKTLPRTLIAKHGVRGQQWLNGHFADEPES